MCWFVLFPFISIGIGFEYGVDCISVCVGECGGEYEGEFVYSSVCCSSCFSSWGNCSLKVKICSCVPIIVMPYVMMD